MGKLIIIGGAVLVFIVIIIIVTIIIVKGNKNKYEVITDEENQQEIVEKKKYKKEKYKNKNKNDNIPIRKDNGLTYYDYYDMTKKEKLIWTVVGMIVVFFIGMIFYNNIIAAGILSLIGLKYPSIKNKDIIQKRKEKLLLQFKECLYSLSASLSAGRAVPSAFKDAYEEMIMVFEDNKDNLISKELKIIIKRMEMNETIEEALNDFSERSNIEEIQIFSDIFSACTKTGGNLKQVILESSKMIGDKIAVKQEIATMVSGKKFEAKILSVIPFAIIFMMKVTAPDLIVNLYTPIGMVMATIAIFVILGSSIWAQKIVRIEV